MDPPPDLALEIEITRGLVGKMAIYESFGVRELWQFDGRKLQVYELAEDGRYRARQSSLCFPALPMAEVERTVRQAGKMHETDLVRGFREWVRKTFAGETGQRTFRDRRIGRGRPWEATEGLSGQTGITD